MVYFLANEPEDQSLSPGTIAGIAIGSVAVLIILCAIFYYLYKRCIKSNDNQGKQSYSIEFFYFSIYKF